MTRKTELIVLATYLGCYAAYNISQTSGAMVCSQALANKQLLRCSNKERAGLYPLNWRLMTPHSSVLEKERLT